MREKLLELCHKNLSPDEKIYVLNNYNDEFFNIINELHCLLESDLNRTTLITKNSIKAAKKIYNDTGVKVFPVFIKERHQYDGATAAMMDSRKHLYYFGGPIKEVLLILKSKKISFRYYTVTSDVAIFN